MVNSRLYLEGQQQEDASFKHYAWLIYQEYKESIPQAVGYQPSMIRNDTANWCPRSRCNIESEQENMSEVSSFQFEFF